MQKLKVGVVGYGNLGKQVAKQLKTNEQFELVAVFSRRKILGCEAYEKISSYKEKIDLMFLCVGSQTDLESTAHKLIKYFNTIDCYDNHNRIKAYIEKQNTLAKQNNKVALCAFGWDPGLFSLMRALFDSLNLNYTTFWGKGLSQGHTQAVKNIANVIDAIQFTIPNKKAIKKIKNGEAVNNGFDLHKRVCYVVCKKEYQNEIKNQIVSMPDYFNGYKTIVKFVSLAKLNKLKSFAHTGEVLTLGEEAKFELKLKSNPAFTANVLVSYASYIAKLVSKQEYGAFTILDLPLNMVLKKEKFHFI